VVASTAGATDRPPAALALTRQLQRSVTGTGLQSVPWPKPLTCAHQARSRRSQPRWPVARRDAGRKPPQFPAPSRQSLTSNRRPLVLASSLRALRVWPRRGPPAGTWSEPRSRDGVNGVLGRCHDVVVDVEPGDLEPASVCHGDIVQIAREQFRCPTPLCPEQQQHQPLSLQDIDLETCVRDIHVVIPSLGDSVCGPRPNQRMATTELDYWLRSSPRPHQPKPLLPPTGRHGSDPLTDRFRMSSLQRLGS
jgi:hypothetical protein